MWVVASMPEETKFSIIKSVRQKLAQAEKPHKISRVNTMHTSVNTQSNTQDMPQAQLTPYPAPVPRVPSSRVHNAPTSQDKAAAKALIVRLAREFVYKSTDKNISASTALEVFVHDYNSGMLQAADWVRASVPRTSRASLHGWAKVVDTHGIDGLHSRKGHHLVGTGAIDICKSIQDVVTAYIYEYAGITAEEIYNVLLALRDGKKIAVRGVLGNKNSKPLPSIAPHQQLPSLRSLQRWMRRYREGNASTILRIQNPDAYKSNNQAAAGSRSEAFTYINELWEMDSSPADILLADGKRYTLLGGIDVVTRRTKIRVFPTSSSLGVCSLLRAMLLAFGVPTTTKIDNGADYTSAQVTTALHRLDILPEYCTPFTPEQKPHIERFFRTFQSRLKTLPGFIGHNVADRQALRAKQSFAQRMAQGEKSAISLNYTLDAFQAYCDDFCDAVYGERKHGQLGCSPNDMAARLQTSQTVRRIEDVRALDILLLPLAGNGGIRTVGKKGIKASGDYNAPELGAYIGQEVQCRLHEDAGYIHVFTLEGDYICMAQDPTQTGADRRVLAQAVTQVQKAIEGQKIKEAKAIIKRVKPQDLVGVTIEHQKEVAAQNSARREAQYPENTIAHTSHALASAHQAAQVAQKAMEPVLPSLPEHEQAKLRAQAAAVMAYSAPKDDEFHAPDNSHDRYQLWLATQKLIVLGEDVPTRQGRWATYYGESRECSSMMTMYALLPPIKAQVQ